MSTAAAVPVSTSDPMRVPPEGAHAEALDAARAIRGVLLEWQSTAAECTRVAEEIDNAAFPIRGFVDLIALVNEDERDTEFSVRSDGGSSVRVRVSVIDDLRNSLDRFAALSRELRGASPAPRRPDEHDIAKGREDERGERIARSAGEP